MRPSTSNIFHTTQRWHACHLLVCFIEGITPSTRRRGAEKKVASLFISHSSSDREAAESLAERLRAEGFAALFVDFDPEQGIPAGRDWERELPARLRKSDAVIFLARAASVASRWCFVEARLLTSDKSEGGEEDAVVEVAHEALLWQWKPLRELIEVRSSLRMRSELERLATDWNQADLVYDMITKRQACCSGGQRG